MHQIFKHTGYTFLPGNGAGKPLTLYYINNPDGSPRWIWPSGLSEPLFLKFYNVATFKARLFTLVIRFIFGCRLQRWCFKSVRGTMECHASVIPSFIPEQPNWAMFTGTPGPNNKLVLLITGNRRIFIKIATSDTAEGILEREVAALQAISALSPATFTVPGVVFQQKGIIGLEDISAQSQRGSYFASGHALALQEIHALTGRTGRLSEMPIGRQTNALLEEIRQINDARLPKGMLKKLALLYAQLQDQTVAFSRCHGDFTSWNMYIKDGKCAIYDWELTADAMPLGYDAFHFVCQQGILVQQAPWKSIRNEIDRRIPDALFPDAAQRPTYLQLYLLIHLVHSLKMYTMQTEWHVQVAWLIQTWNEALTEQVGQPAAARGSLILDTFDFLQNKAYAALKFPGIAPEELPLYSDMDLCMSRSTASALYQFLSQHFLTHQIRRVRKSFMDTLEIQTSDGALLHIDLIFQLKRKSLEIMDVNAVINAASVNTYGVKVAQAADNARFVALFYVLNNQNIPEKYQNGQLDLAANPDPLLAAAYGNKLVRPLLVAGLKAQPANRGLAGLRNQWNYVVDTISGFRASFGFVVTFSGVDGAGKSTVIEHVKYELEKRHRKRVVVIRHRPSVLPILSAWTKGKQNAERASAQTLPRQGNNQSLLSSFLRFGYYYSDYLVGQFYVYLRYVCGGYVVLYDRYYFDFINDSKRSNIQLPKSWVMAGYHWLLKPHYNFFLYASPEVILARKQELDKATIQGLTNDYITLFKRLNTSPKAGYFTLENIDLEKTKQNIMSTLYPR